jgi:hypothetical protein
MNTQIDFVRRAYLSIDAIRAITTTFRMNKTTYYQMFPYDQQPATQFTPILSMKVGCPLLVPLEMESRLLVHIRESQERYNCLSPKECRERSLKELSNQNNPVIVGRYWWHRFLA